mmetsp:Transcript_3930/g.9555  ORF Transcript_3930/g.9555 Transcript_3930/m.9555 type:complete len:564 (-) Transcript_3930:143-1834(-)
MKGQESAGSPPGLFGAQPPFAANPAASPVPGSMLAPPGSTGSRAPLARPGGGLHAGGPPVSAKRPRTTPISGRFVFGGDASPMVTLSGVCPTRTVISPFTNFAASLTPLYPSAVQAALPTPLAQLMHGSNAARRHGVECGEFSHPKPPRRVVTFGHHSGEQTDCLPDLDDESSVLEHTLRSGQTLTPFTDQGLPDWTRGSDPDSIGRILSIQPTQRGLSPLTSPGGDAEQRKQTMNKRRLQFECDQVAALDHLGTGSAACTPLRTPSHAAHCGHDEPWIMFQEEPAILGTLLAGCEGTPVPMLGTPNSLKEAFRLSEGLPGAKTKPRTAPSPLSKQPAPALPPPIAAGAQALKPKRDRGKENGKCKPRTCNCKHSKCIKLYCDCFSAGQFCLESCKCNECLNNADNETQREEARKSILERNSHAFTDKVKRLQDEGAHTKGCNCKNSKCMKKYCECYQAGVSCSDKCKCVGCSNGKPGSEEREADLLPDKLNASAHMLSAHKPLPELVLNLRATPAAAASAADTQHLHQPGGLQLGHLLLQILPHLQLPLLRRVLDWLHAWPL